MKNRYTICIWLLCLVWFVPQFAQGQTTRVSTLNIARGHVLKGDAGSAIESYSALVERNVQRKAKYSYADSELLLEYAYALALGGIYDGALMNLDRVVLMGENDYVYFYAAQVFDLMGYPELADELWKPTNKRIPRWIASDYDRLAHEYERMPVINQDGFVKAFERANTLASQNLYMQSVVIFQEIIDNYPDQYLPYIGYSGVWETLGFKSKAAEVLQAGIDVLESGNAAQISETSVGTYKTHLTELEKEIVRMDSNKQNPFVKSVRENRLNMMLYAGGMFSSSMISFNSRFGLYTKSNFNVSLDLGISGMSKTIYGDVGLSTYYTFRWLVVGLGLNERLGKNYSALSVKPSVGVSLLSKKRSSSFDIMLNFYVPVSSGANPGCGLSFGKSFYFGNR